MRLRGLTLALSISLATTIVGCGEPAKSSDAAKSASSPDKAEPQPQPQPEPPSGDVLSLGTAKIMRAGHEDRAIELNADGSVTLAGAPFAQLSTDGTVLDPSGETMLRVQADGTVVSGDGSPTAMKLTAKGGELTRPELQVEISFGDDGTIAMRSAGSHAALLGSGTPPLVSSGCTGPMLRTCSLIALTYLSALGNPDSVQQDDAPAPG